MSEGQYGPHTPSARVIQDNYANPAHPTELEIALSEAIDDVEGNLE